MHRSARDTVIQAEELLAPRHCCSNNLQKTARAVSRVYADAMRPAGLTRSQFPILGTLAAAGPMATSELAARLYMERTTITRHLTPLEDAGFVTRAADPDDARVRRVAITPTGRRKLAQAGRLWRRAQARMIERFGAKEWQRLEDALRTLRRLTR
jgi:DNA-binding MarR family transcriptional regulator